MLRSTDRRHFLAVLSSFGFASTLLPGTLWALAQNQPRITRQIIDDAAALAGVKIEDAQKDMMIEALNDQIKGFEAIHDLHLPNSEQMALIFDPLLPGMAVDTERKPARISAPELVGVSGVPRDLQEIAFYSVRQLAELVRNKKVSSAALTDLYIGRLKKYDPILKIGRAHV